MKSTHTPAPWKIFWGNYTHFATINKDTNKRICAIEIKDNKEIDEQTANVRLMAAAPELLDALELADDVLRAITENHGSKYDGSLTQIQIADAIKKATE